MAEMPLKTDESVPLEREEEPGVPRFMWLLYAALIGWGIYYVATQIVMPAGSPYLAAPIQATATAAAQAFVAQATAQAQSAAQTTPGTGGAVIVVQPTATPPPVTELPSDTVLDKGNVAQGQQIFASQACAACHQVTGTAAPVCPNLSQIGTQAPEIIKEAAYNGKATTGLQYLYESIVNPSAYVVQGFNDGIMPNNFRTLLSEQQIIDIVAYLNSLKGG